MTRSTASRIAWVMGTFVLIVLIASAASLALRWRQSTRARMRAEALPITIRQAQPIIEAIARYTREQGSAPKSLSEMLPRYIKEIPLAGPAAEDGWHFEADAGEEAGGWALKIKVRDEYSPNLLGFGDTFVFHPSGKYPRLAYGGVLVPFGHWGYYVE